MIKRKIKIDQYEVGSPERCFAQFAQGWMVRNIIKMYEVSQEYWKLKYQPSDLSKVLEIELINLICIDRVDNKEINSLIVVDLVVTARVRIGGKEFTIKLLPRLIKESEEGNPCINGTWGVNPVSALKKK